MKFYKVCYEPCGHEGFMTRDELLKLGKRDEVNAFDLGQKHDAITVYSEACNQCERLPVTVRSFGEG